MIVPMKKAYLFFIKRVERNALKKLRSLGFFHLEMKVVSNGYIEKHRQQIKVASEVNSRLNEISKPDPVRKNDTLSPEVIDKQIHDCYALLEEEQQIFAEIEQRKKDIALLQPWGNFEPQMLKELQQQGGNLELYYLNAQQLSQLDDFSVSESCAYWLFQKLEDGRTCTAFFLRETLTKPDFLPASFSPPELGLQAQQEKLKQLEKDLDHAQQRLRSFLYLQNVLEHYLDLLYQQVEFEEACEGLEKVEEEFVYAEGYLPAESEEILLDSAKRYGWGLVIRDPEEEEEVPTQLKQNFISRLINPVLGFLETTPGYREVDVTGVFFSFFTIFVAMIMGDAAYGLIIFLASIMLVLFQKRFTTLAGMLFVLGGATFIWGALSGSWFASFSLAQAPLFRQLSLWQLSPFPEQIFNKDPLAQQNFIMYLCFSLAVVHLTIARLWSFVRAFPRLQSIAHLGSVMLLVALYQLVLFMVKINPLFDKLFVYMLAAGFATLVIFGQQSKGQNFFIGIGKGLAGLFTTFLDTVNIFADIMSYVRLFAVGIASFSIASSFNNMAEGLFDKGGVIVVFALIVLVIGHVINFALGCLSVVVHAVRLNMLEFSNHMGLEWGGFPYRPFKEKKINL